MIARPGSFPWLVRHELRLGWRARARARGISGLIGWAVLFVYCGIGVLVAVSLVDTPVAWSPAVGAGVLAGSVAALSFMIAQGLLAGQRTLYEVRDLDLLFTAPLPARRVLAAKLVGVAASIAISYAVLLGPLLVPFALLGHPRLFGAAGLALALALAGAAIGLALCLLLARTIGARGARTIGQILAALIGAAFYLVTQLGRLRHGIAYAGVYGWARAHGLRMAGVSAWPGRAAFGDPVALAGLLLAAALLFAATGAALEAAFLRGYQEGGARISRRRMRAGGIAGAFHAGLNGAMFAKERRLLLRDPALLFRIVLRLVYLVPLLLVGLRQGGTLLVPGIAFAGVVVASQLVGSIAWLTISGEDAPELLAVAPVDKAVLGRAKLLAALAVAAPIAAIVPLALLFVAPAGAIVTALFTAASGWCCGQVELQFGKPGARAQFAQRGRGSSVAAIVATVVAMMFGGVAAAATWWLDPPVQARPRPVVSAIAPPTSASAIAPPTIGRERATSAIDSSTIAT